MLISDFARLGQVSVRMLRHYDALGLLVPDHVEPASGYRSYSPEQLHLLNRLVALKDLGFTLDRHVGPRPPPSAASTSARWRASRSRGSPAPLGPDNGYHYDGPCRELNVRAESDDRADWVTELQQPVTR